MRGAECSTDHHLICSILRLTVRPPARKQKPRHKHNVHAAHNQNIREELCNAIDQSLSHISTTTTLNCTSNLTLQWKALSSALLIASTSTLGNMERRHQDWFDDNATDIRSLIHDKNAAHNALLRNPTSRTLRERFSSKRATVRRKLRWMENNWWAGKAAQIQSYANINDTKSFYEALKGVCGPRRFSLHPVRSTDGDLIKNKELILERWAEYLQNLLNKVHTTSQAFWMIYRHCRSSQNLMTHHPLMKWKRPFSVSKTTKQPFLTTSLLRSFSMVGVLYTEGCIILSAKYLPQQWENANIILVYQQKGDRAECGISFLPVAGKVLAKIILTRLLKHVVDLVFAESQSGFRRGRNTIEMIFVAQQQQENFCKQHQDLYLAFVDLTKAFDTVNRDLLWNILHKFGCFPTFIATLQQFNTGVCAQVIMAGSQSYSFPVEVGVKQSCVLAPIIFNLLLVAITLVSHHDMQSSDFVGIEYRLDGGLFNL